MLDIKRIREQSEIVQARLSLRGRDFSEEIQEALRLDAGRREIIIRMETIKAEQNAASKEIPQRRKSGEDTAPLMARLKTLSDEATKLSEELRTWEEKLDQVLLGLPNTPQEDTPPGLDSEANVVVRSVGEIPNFDFATRPHWELGEALNILDSTRAAKVTGARFHFYRGLGARLERAIMNFYLDTHTSRGYLEMFPPFLVNRASMTGTGQLPKFEADAFKTAEPDYFLIPTAEVPVTNYHRDEILDAAELPLSYCAYSACFRAEAGSAGRDTRGLIRQHQFNKVELVKFTAPEDSNDALEALTADAEEVLRRLGLPYRVVRLCGGDLGVSSSKTYDLEVYMPSYGRYVEISSCSNFLDYQARRMGIRFRAPGGKPQFVHTLNGSGVALGRTTAAILELFQRADGSVGIPEALRPYMGCDEIR